MSDLHSSFCILCNVCSDRDVYTRRGDFRSYKGVWHQDKMHGCGIKLLTNDSESTEQAGRFIADEYVGLSKVCSVATAQQAARQALAAAHQASGLQVSCCPHCAPSLTSLWSRYHLMHMCRRGKVLKAFSFGVTSHIKGALFPAMPVRSKGG